MVSDIYKYITHNHQKTRIGLRQWLIYLICTLQPWLVVNRILGIKHKKVMVQSNYCDFSDVDHNILFYSITLVSTFQGHLRNYDPDGGSHGKRMSKYLCWQTVIRFLDIPLLCKRTNQGVVFLELILIRSFVLIFWYLFLGTKY